MRGAWPDPGSALLLGRGRVSRVDRWFRRGLFGLWRDRESSPSKVAAIRRLVGGGIRSSRWVGRRPWSCGGTLGRSPWSCVVIALIDRGPRVPWAVVVNVTRLCAIHAQAQSSPPIAFRIRETTFRRKAVSGGGAIRVIVSSVPAVAVVIAIAVTTAVVTSIILGRSLGLGVLRSPPRLVSRIGAPRGGASGGRGARWVAPDPSGPRGVVCREGRRA